MRGKVAKAIRKYARSVSQQTQAHEKWYRRLNPFCAKSGQSKYTNTVTIYHTGYRRAVQDLKRLYKSGKLTLANIAQLQIYANANLKGGE